MAARGRACKSDRVARNGTRRGPAPLRTGEENLHGIELEVVEKRVKRLNLRVYPPDGRVRLTVPLGTPRAVIRAMVAERAGWIRAHQRRLRALPQPTATLYVSGETHFVDGRPRSLRLQVGPRRAVQLDGDHLRLLVTPQCDRAARGALLEGWYRQRLQAALPDLVAVWTGAMALPTPEYRVKRMKTRWGSCNPRARRIWLNLALAQRRPELLEYVVVHELAHLRVADHGPAFKALMSRHLPRWQELDRELDEWPIWARTPAGYD